MFNNTETVMKYQVIPEDLDVLVSIRTDEDLGYMVEEYDRHESLPRSPSSSSRFRVFLFPSATALPSTPRSPSYTDIQNRPNFTVSNSLCTSPTSTVDYRAGVKGMQRVRSTPNLSGSLSASASQQKSRMGGGGGAPRHEACGCQHCQRRNSGYFGHFHGGGGYACHHGHAEEGYRPRSGQGSFQFGGQPPVAPRRSIWE